VAVPFGHGQGAVGKGVWVGLLFKMDGHGQDQSDHAHFLNRSTIPYPLED